MTTTTLDFVSHDLEMMMPGSQLMLTGGAGGSQYQSMPGGMAPPMGQPPMGGSAMGGYPSPSSPYPPQARPPY
mgnify:CR=1 FL=1